MKRGFGIPATNDAERAATLATTIEQLGYRTVWTNDIPKADGLWTAAQMAAATTHLRVGVGVAPIDRRPPAAIAAEIERLQIPLDRLSLGIGAGRSERPIRAMGDAVAELRELVGPDLCLGISAMGPQMCRLAGQIADFVLFNWMTPPRLEWAARLVDGAAADLEKRTEKFSYVRVAIGEEAAQRLQSEAFKYNSVPAYERHFRAMGHPVEQVGIAAEAAEVPAQLAPYDRVLDEGVVRALPAGESVESTLAVARASAPAGLV